MTSMNDRNVGRYEIVRKLGAGGMGEVYEASDPQLKRRVALKRLPPGLARDEDAARRLLVEARSAARITHQGVAALYDVIEADDELYVVMEYVDGTTLRSVPRPMPLDDFLELAVQAAEALEAAHACDVVHGDIKPTNLMLTAAGKLKLLDFGVAGLTTGVREEDPTTVAAPPKPGALGWTPSYAAPEVLRGRPSDRRADLFSVGLVFFELLTGENPFRGETHTETAARILTDDPTPVGSLNPDVPAELEGIIRKLMAKDPEARYPTARALAEDLRNLRDDRAVTSGSRPPGGVRGGPPTGAVRAAWRRSPTAWRVGLAAALTIVVVLGVLTARDWLPDTTAGPTGTPTTAAFDPTEWVIAVMPRGSTVDADAAIGALNEGLAVTLTARLASLSREHGLQVIPAATLSELQIDTLRRAREELGVTLAINYVTRAIGERGLRVDATLVDVADQRQLDAGTVEGTSDDLIDLEERVALQVLDMLRVELSQSDQASLQAGTSEPAAYELFLRGQGRLAGYDDPDNVDAAIDLFQQALQADPTYASVHAALGSAFWHRYDLTKEALWIDRATQECRRAQELDGGEALAHLCLGQIYSGTGEPELAADALSRAIALDPTLDSAYVELGRVYQDLGKPDLAEETYRRAIATRPHYWAGHQWLGAFLLRQGRIEEAIASFLEQVRLAPQSSSGYRNLGTAHYFAEDWDDARRAFERALEIRPDDETTLSNLATLHFFQRRYADAARLFEQAARLDENNYFRWGQLADAYYWAPGERDKAAASYRRAIELADSQLEVNPRDVDVLIDLAFYHAMLDEAEPATDRIERALQLASDQGYVLAQAAKVYHRLGDDDAALRHLESALAADYPIAEIRAEPVFDDLAGEPRFESLLDARDR